MNCKIQDLRFFDDVVDLDARIIEKLEGSKDGELRVLRQVHVTCRPQGQVEGRARGAPLFLPFSSNSNTEMTARFLA